MEIKLRKGLKKDIPGALKLVKELAVFEKAPKEVEVTVEEMTNWGFGKNKLFGFYVLENKGAIIGMALYYYKYSTWKGKCLFLEDIVITQKERNKGYGKLLFNKMLELAKKQKVRRLEWQVLEWNANAIAFYSNYKTEFDNEWVNCKLRYKQLQSL
ncbi:MAG: GNAT family N-acetyltransferase [Bacteroidia bacterium]|nr:GNAT family N-acetyltransferase [Bacteroidia bacterium]